MICGGGYGELIGVGGVVCDGGYGELIGVGGERLVD